MDSTVIGGRVNYSRVFNFVCLVGVCLLPFCAIPVSLLSDFQYNDLSKIVFSIVGVIVIVVGRMSFVSTFRIASLFVFGILVSFNAMACLSLAADKLDYGVSIGASTIKLSVWLISSVILPLCGALYICKTIPRIYLNRAILVAVSCVICVGLLQASLLLNIETPLSNLYKTSLYKFLEGSWGNQINLNKPYSSVVETGRISSTFEEPSFFAQFFVFVAVPFLISSFVNESRVIKKVAIFVLFLIGIVEFSMSFSTTGYLVFSLDICVLLVIFIFQSKAASWQKVVTPLVVFAVVGSVIWVAKEYFFRIVLRAFFTGNLSSATRLGSIVGGLNLLFDFPLGVGFTDETHVVFRYLPSWGKTIETSMSSSTIHSGTVRMLAQVGLLGGGIIMLLGFLKFYLPYLQNLRKRQMDYVKGLWLLNFLITSIYSDIQFGASWFLFSAAYSFTQSTRGNDE